MVPHEHAIGLSLLFFGLGLITLLMRRNLLLMLVGAETMGISLALIFVGFARMRAALAPGETGQVLEGQLLAFLVLAVVFVQLAIGLAMLVAFVRRRGSTDVEGASVLRW